FVAYDPGHPGALWKSDGTPHGTVFVKDVLAGNLTNVGGFLYFSGNGGGTGWELWKSDGTPSGTTEVADLLEGPASTYPTALTDVGGTLYFGATGTAGFQLWKLDGPTT